MAIGAAYAKGKWAVGECARSGRKMLLRNMIADGYYPNLIVDPEWYEPKHPQESLPSVRDPTSLFRPAPERDQIGRTVLLGGIAAVDPVPVGGFGTPIIARGTSLPFGYSMGQVTSDFTPAPPPPAGTKASDYGSTENELANNPEPRGGTFRFDVFWKPDGTRAYTAWGLGSEIGQNDVSPPWTIAVGWTNRVQTANISNLRSIWWSPDGTKLSASTRVPSTAFRITSWDQSATPWDLTVLGAAVSKTIGVASGGPLDHIWSADGLTMWQFYTGAIFQIIEYAASVAFDPTTLGTAVANFDMTPDTGTKVTSIAFSTDGTVMYATTFPGTPSGTDLVSWSLSVPFDVTTMTDFTTGPNIIASDLSIPRGLNVRASNQDIFVTGDQNTNRVAWFRLGTP